MIFTTSSFSTEDPSPRITQRLRGETIHLLLDLIPGQALSLSFLELYLPLHEYLVVLEPQQPQGGTRNTHGKALRPD